MSDSLAGDWYPYYYLWGEYWPYNWNYYTWPQSEKKPHLCPVCNGKGTVPRGFYEHGDFVSSTNAGPEQCKACLGQGIVWG